MTFSKRLERPALRDLLAHDGPALGHVDGEELERVEVVRLEPLLDESQLEGAVQLGRLVVEDVVVVRVRLLIGAVGALARELGRRVEVGFVVEGAPVPREEERTGAGGVADEESVHDRVAVPDAVAVARLDPPAVRSRRPASALLLSQCSSPS